MTVITPLPNPPPQRTLLPAAFIVAAGAFMAAIFQMVTEFNNAFAAIAAGVAPAGAVSTFVAGILNSATAAIFRATFGQGRTKLFTGTIASASSYWLSLTGGYTIYEIEIEDLLPATNSQALLAEFSINNRSTTLTGYYFAGDDIGTAGTRTANGSGSATAIILARNVFNSAGVGNHYTMKFKQSSATGRPTLRSELESVDGSGGILEGRVAAQVTTSSPVTDILLLMNSGNLQAAKITLYGLE